jgi:aminoglycoside phosphotransferase (APT) family kinase protein
MSKRERFREILERKGYRIEEKKLGGGFVNDVRLIRAAKGSEIIEYVSKTYGSKEDMRDMLRGYDMLSGVVKTPTIVYQNNDTCEIVYDLVKGKSLKEMIIEGNKEAPKAIAMLARELQTLHDSKKISGRYKNDDSPDERKMILHAMKACAKRILDKEDAIRIISQIRQYVPKTKATIHGDAHLGNFMYSSEGEIYLIDSDNVKKSDPNADLGKIVYAIDEIADNGKISRETADKLREVLLATYEGEEERAVNLHKMRTPLIDIKGEAREAHSKNRIRQTLATLEARVATMILSGFVIILAFFKLRYTGMTIYNVYLINNSYIPISIIILIILFYFVYLIIKKCRNKLR